jgi:hypothetical protein
MDPWHPLPGKKDEEKTAGWFYDESGINKDARDYPEYDLIRKNMGYAREYAERIDLINMIPRSEISSTHYCLADEGNAYLIYFPEGGEAKINLTGATGEYTVEWFIPVMNRKVVSPQSLKGGRHRTMEPPVSLDAVLYLRRN